jgi:hypothetical protein
MWNKRCCGVNRWWGHLSEAALYKTITLSGWRGYACDIHDQKYPAGS